MKGTVIIWNVQQGRKMKEFNYEGGVDALAWNPNPQVCLLAVANDHALFIASPRVYA